MNNPPLVSIITPFFNADAFFEEAIASVLAQTYPYWELWLVDDGSRDRSTQIAQTYASQYPDRIFYLQHPDHQNLGKSTSRNLGIKHARGKYLALLDADDCFLPEKLERQVAILENQSQVGMVYGPTLYWYSWSGNPRDRRRDVQSGLGVKPDTLVSPPHLATLYLKNPSVVPCTCGLLVQRTLVEALGGFDEAIQHLYEDQVFLFKICLESSVFVESGCWDRYRQHLNSSSQVAIQQKAYHPFLPNPVRQAFLEWLKTYMMQKDINDDQLWEQYQYQYWPYKHPRLSWFISPVQYTLLRLRIWLKSHLLSSAIIFNNRFNNR